MESSWKRCMVRWICNGTLMMRIGLHTTHNKNISVIQSNSSLKKNPFQQVTTQNYLKNAAQEMLEILKIQKTFYQHINNHKKSFMMPLQPSHVFYNEVQPKPIYLEQLYFLPPSHGHIFFKLRTQFLSQIVHTPTLIPPNPESQKSSHVQFLRRKFVPSSKVRFSPMIQVISLINFDISPQRQNRNNASSPRVHNTLVSNVVPQTPFSPLNKLPYLYTTNTNTPKNSFQSFIVSKSFRKWNSSPSYASYQQFGW